MRRRADFHNPKTAFRIVECANAEHHIFISRQGISFRIAKSSVYLIDK
jgi:hypothetical protein